MSIHFWTTGSPSEGDVDDVQADGSTEVQRIMAPESPPPVVETRFVGRLEFEGGFPTEATVQRLYDQLDFQRGCQVFLRHMMAAAIWGFQAGVHARPGHGAGGHPDAPRGRARAGPHRQLRDGLRGRHDRHQARPGRSECAAAGARVPERPVDAAHGRRGHRRARPGPGGAIPARAAGLRGRASRPMASWRRCACARTASGSCYAPSWVRAATRLRDGDPPGHQDRALVRFGRRSADSSHRRHRPVLRHDPPDGHPLLRGPRRDGGVRAHRRDHAR